MDPLVLNIGGYTTHITKDESGAVSLQIDLGFFGSQTLTIPQPEWEQIVDYVNPPESEASDDGAETGTN